MSPLGKVSWVGLLAVLVLTGCTTARIISRDSSGGIVAIPENSNRWPHQYRDQALEIIKQDCPNGYAIAKEEEVVTGTVTTDSSPNSTTRTSETHNRTEYRLYYVRAKPVQIVTPELRRVPVARVVPPPPPCLPPTPVPYNQ